MSKTISAPLAAHLQSEVTTLCTCWKITRTDAVTIAFTDHDVDLVFEGDTYSAAGSYSRTAMSNNDTLSVDNLDISGVIDDDHITASALRNGLFNYAEVKVFVLNWADVSMGALKMRKGWFGEVTLQSNGSFKTELRGMTQRLSYRFGEVYQPTCRADLGDTRCKVVIATYTVPGAVGIVTARKFLTVASGYLVAPEHVSAWFDGGVLRFTSGANLGKSVEVKYWNASTRVLELFIPPPYAIEVGDTFDIYPGCDKRRETCFAKFANMLNFRGEPDIPGADVMQKYPDAV